MGLGAGAVLPAAYIHIGRQIKGQPHAGGHGLAMKQAAVIPGNSFKSMTKCMSQIEQCALTGFAFVSLDDACLGCTGCEDYL